MSSAEPKTKELFSVSAQKRLFDYCAEKMVGGNVNPFALTPDASVREYYRIPWNNAVSAIVALYPEPFAAATQPFLDVTNLFQAAGLPVPEIYDVDEKRGLIIQEDFGDRQLFDYYRSATEDDCERLLESAINLIARIQGATQLAFERKSIASKLAFDFDKLNWELGFFVEHFFSSLRKERLNKKLAGKLQQELNTLAQELADKPRVLCHRDFHSSNLLVDAAGELRVIDYQDARQGPASYDLVSLLLDRVTRPPSLARIRAGRLLFLEERVAIGLPRIDNEEFTTEFRLMTIQRVLKAIGTFSFQIGVRGRGGTYARYIQPMLCVALQAAELLGRFPVLQEVITARRKDEYC